MLYWTLSSRTQFGVSINVWRLARDTLNITCNFLYCNHQVHWEFLITLYSHFSSYSPIMLMDLPRFGMSLKLLFKRDTAFASFHCSHKESCSAVRTTEATQQITDCRIMGSENGCLWMVVNTVVWFLSWWNFLNWCQDRRDSSVCLGIMEKNSGTSAEWLSYM
jgi:hypothetical protein